MSLLDARLRAVLDLIPPGSRLLDIGTDHCKLPAEGLLSGRLAAAWAADVREGPLAAARKQLHALALADRVPLYLSDGLKAIPREVLEQVTAVACAGMGGELIWAIIQSAPAEPPLWVLQPMSAIYELYDALAENGYRIPRAALAYDNDKFYRVLTVRRTGEVYPPDYFGALKADPLYPAYWAREEARLAAALDGLTSARTPDEMRIARQQMLLSAIRKEKP